jgi:16S rRNA (adenine1518-N6/adenine1519-N6)-dimethyltransferase
VARAGESEYGSFSVIVQVLADVKWLGRVKAGSFAPAPKVEGAFVGLILKDLSWSEGELERFKRNVRLAFAQRRKTLENTLAAAGGKEQAREILRRSGIAGQRRAQELSPAQLFALLRPLSGREEP